MSKVIILTMLRDGEARVARTDSWEREQPVVFVRIREGRMWKTTVTNGMASSF